MLMRRHSSSWIGIVSCSALALAGCDGGAGDGPGSNPGPRTGIAGQITESAIWSGTVHLTAEAVIAPGVTITVEPGTRFEAEVGAQLYVEGMLEVAGTAESPVIMEPAGDMAWGGIVVSSGGGATLTHARGENVATLLYCHEGAVACRLDSVEFTGIGNAMVTHAPAAIEKSTLIDLANGGVTVNARGDLTIVDTYILTSTHDLVITSAGSRLSIDHSEIGGAQGSYEHCNLHVSAADSLTITNSTITSGVYGMMLGNTRGAVIRYNNFTENDPNQDILEVGPNTDVDMTANYWDQGAPSLGAAYDTSSPAAQPYAEAGPRI